MKACPSKRSFFRKNFYDEIDEFIPYVTTVATSWNEYAKGLANGKIILYHLKTYDADVQKINEFLYSFNGDEWTKSFIQISDDVKKVMLQCDSFVHIMCVKNSQKERCVNFSNTKTCLFQASFLTRKKFQDKSSMFLRQTILKTNLITHLSNLP